MDNKDIISFVNKFKDKRILVVGDIMLDNYLYGVVDRINPEMPSASLLRILDFDYRLGGAGNVAKNFSSLGANVILCGLLGNDSFKDTVVEICKKDNIGLLYEIEGETLVKQRIKELAHNNYITRIDFGEKDLKEIEEKSKFNLLNEVIKLNIDALVLSDYNKRLFKGDFAAKLIDWAVKNNIPIFVDPKPSNILSFKNSTLIRPNEKEAREIAGKDYSNSDIKDVLRKIKEITQSKYVIVTRGKNGMVSFDGDFHYIPTHAKEIIDVSGAGDTVLAAVTLGILSGADLITSSKIGNYAAGIVVEKPGTSSATQQELIERILSDN